MDVTIKRNCNNMDESQMPYPKWKKAEKKEKEKPVLYTSIYRMFWKRQDYGDRKQISRLLGLRMGGAGAKELGELSLFGAAWREPDFCFPPIWMDSCLLPNKNLAIGPWCWSLIQRLLLLVGSRTLWRTRSTLNVLQSLQLPFPLLFHICYFLYSYMTFAPFSTSEITHMSFTSFHLSFLN